MKKLEFLSVYLASTSLRIHSVFVSSSLPNQRASGRLLPSNSGLRMNLWFCCFLQDLINCNVISVTGRYVTHFHLHWVCNVFNWKKISSTLEWPTSFSVHFHLIHQQIVIFSRNVSVNLRNPPVSIACEIFWSELTGNFLTQFLRRNPSLHYSWNSCNILQIVFVLVCRESHYRIKVFKTGKSAVWILALYLHFLSQFSSAKMFLYQCRTEIPGTASQFCIVTPWC